MWRVNEHGRLYAQGKSLSKDLRLLIINKIILSGGDALTGVFPGTYTGVANSLGVSSLTVSNIWKRYCDDGTISPRKNGGGNPSHLSEGDLQYIEFLKQQQPSISYDEIKEKLHEFGDLPYGTTSTMAISEAVRNRLPSGAKYSFKKIQTIAQERFTLQNMAYTQLFVDYLGTKDPYTLKFFDECGLKLPQHGTRSHGHAPVGERAIEYRRYAESPNTTVNLMCSLTGVDYVNTVDGSSDTVDFLTFFEEAYNSINIRSGRPCLDPGSVIVMDNCATHHHQGGHVLQEFLNDLDIELVYMPAYSPDFNPAEYVFGKLRTVMKYRFSDITTVAQLIQCLYTSLDFITPSDMRGFFEVTEYINL